MSLNKEETVKLYKDLSGIIQESKVYDEGLIPTLYTIILKDLFSELKNGHIKCYTTKTRHLMCEAWFDSKERYKLNYVTNHNNEVIKIRGFTDAIHFIQDILTKDLGLSPKDRYMTQNTPIQNADTILFLVTPVLDHYKDTDLLEIFKELQVFLCDQKGNNYFMILFWNILYDLFREFKHFVEIDMDINRIYCTFNNELEMRMAIDTLTSFFGFTENDNLDIAPQLNKITIMPIDNRNYKVEDVKKNG